MGEDNADLGHPDSMVRLASAVHRFRCPEIDTMIKICYSRSFNTAGGHPTTRALTAQADACRASLEKALAGSEGGKNVSHTTIVSASQNYLPLINQILLSCQFQPEVARLDEKLQFSWASGIEKEKKFFTSEALMYELVMTMTSQALGSAGVGADECINGDFAAASRAYKSASAIMKFLAEDQLPKWIGRGSSVEEQGMPSEAKVGVCDAFQTLFLAVAQQMAVATVLIKPGSPNYGLLGKLCLGIAEHMDLFESAMRSKAPAQQELMDENFFLLVTFQSGLQRALSMYFQARSMWDSKEDHGLAIAMMKESLELFATRSKKGSASAKGLPIIDGKKCPLRNLVEDLNDARAHIKVVLKNWERDNASIYFDSTPKLVPEEKKLSSGMMMIKPEPFALKDVEPAPLMLPGPDPPSTKSWGKSWGLFGRK